MDKEKIIKNLGLRFIAKICLNSLWGKFGQNLDRDDIIYVSSKQEYYQYLEKAKRCEDVNETVCVMRIGGKKKLKL